MLQVLFSSSEFVNSKVLKKKGKKTSLSDLTVLPLFGTKQGIGKSNNIWANELVITYDTVIRN